jgi:ACS family sodium-dependent inorganic phosphate cotransporter-like MFS transporter 6/7/8
VAPVERGRLCSLVFTGVYAGGIVGYPLGGLLTHHLGWKYVFYVNGAIGLVWCLVWLFVGYKKPSQHPTIDDRELAHVEMAIAEAGEDNLVVKTPWRSILTSLPVMSLCIAHFARSWVFFLMLTNEPAYLTAFNLDIAQTGLISAVPWIFFLLASALSGPLSDYIRRDGVFNNTFVRKLFTCGGFGVEGICLLILFFLRDRNPALIFLSIGIGFGGFTVAGWQINHQARPAAVHGESRVESYSLRCLRG